MLPEETRVINLSTHNMANRMPEIVLCGFWAWGGGGEGMAQRMSRKFLGSRCPVHPRDLAFEEEKGTRTPKRAKGSCCQAVCFPRQEFPRKELQHAAGGGGRLAAS